jgi:hypothetical protein
MSVARTLIAVLLPLSSQVFADLSQMKQDGWHTWRVAATEGAPEWCCHAWHSGSVYASSCDLDGRQTGYGSATDNQRIVDQMQIYAHLQEGQITKIRAFSTRCPVTANTDIVDLGFVATASSIAWLEKRLQPHTKLSTDALAAIAVHDGQESLNLLLDVAESSAALENRKDAVFWMGQLRATEAEADMKRLMFNDANAKFREHAAFVLSQSNASGRIEALAKLGRDDGDGDVRSQAWFWLAQTGSAEAEAQIQRALHEERDTDVREQAIFALSQLPEERAAKALAIVIENRQLGENDRKHALFWLAQLGSDAAMSYVDRLLSGN